MTATAVVPPVQMGEFVTSFEVYLGQKFCGVLVEIAGHPVGYFDSAAKAWGGASCREAAVNCLTYGCAGAATLVPYTWSPRP